MEYITKYCLLNAKKSQGAIHVFLIRFYAMTVAMSPSGYPPTTR